jgi:hypothetical protein
MRVILADDCSSPAPATVLRACGWLKPDAGLTRVRNLSSSHSVIIATREDGREAVVKLARSGGQRRLNAELFVYRLASWMPELAGVTARPIHIDEAAQVLAMEALPGTSRMLERRRDPRFFCKAGALLARVHMAISGQRYP